MICRVRFLTLAVGAKNGRKRRSCALLLTTFTPHSTNNFDHHQLIGAVCQWCVMETGLHKWLCKLRGGDANHSGSNFGCKPGHIIQMFIVGKNGFNRKRIVCSQRCRDWAKEDIGALLTLADTIPLSTAGSSLFPWNQKKVRDLGHRW